MRNRCSEHALAIAIILHYTFMTTRPEAKLFHSAQDGLDTLLLGFSAEHPHPPRWPCYSSVLRVKQALGEQGSRRCLVVPGHGAWPR